MRLSDRVSGVALVALGAAAAIGGSRLPGVPGQDVGPSVFPMVVGAGLMLCGSLIALGIGRSFEDAEEEAPHSWWYGLRALLPPALLILYVLLVERLGFLPTAALLVAIASVALGATWRIALPLAIVAPLAVHAAFAKLLRVPLPDGLLAAPW
jgi:putative tricarboxylic transport membrane protein